MLTGSSSEDFDIVTALVNLPTLSFPMTPVGYILAVDTSTRLPLLSERVGDRHTIVQTTEGDILPNPARELNLHPDMRAAWMRVDL